MLVVERREHLGAQVVGDEALVSVELGHRRGQIVDGPQPDSGKHERCRPAFRPLDEHVDLLVVQLDPAPLHEQRAGLARSER